MQADNPPVAHPRRKLRPVTRAAYACANLEAGAISREQAAVHLGVGCSTLEKLAARGEGPFCFGVGNLVRYPVDELDAWKRANDARQAHTLSAAMGCPELQVSNRAFADGYLPCTQEQMACDDPHRADTDR
jgi:excisionase family DNA binding protein